jgi:ribosome biogenesis GTPase A
MTKAKRMMTEDIKLIDVVVELIDARVPISSKNPDIDNIAKNKSRVIVLNKYDLADQKITNQWKEYFEEKGFFVCVINSKSGNGIKNVTEVIKQACKEKIERDRKRGIINRPVRAMIVGIPNVGKSTFINSYAKKACTKTGNKPGVTKGKQWIRLNKDVELLDTPGILWPKFDNQEIGINLALIGSIREEILNVEELAVLLVAKLKERYPSLLEDKLTCNCDMEDIEILNSFAQNRGCLKKGGELDLLKAAKLLLDDFQAGKLGYISLESPIKECTEENIEKED